MRGIDSEPSGESRSATGAAVGEEYVSSDVGDVHDPGPHAEVESSGSSEPMADESTDVELLDYECDMASAATDERLFIPVQLNEGDSCRALIDSGAARSIIPERVVARLGLKISNDGVSLDCFGKLNRLQSMGTALAQVSIHGRNVGVHEFIVLPTAHMSNIVILGLDFLVATGMKVDSRRSRITLTIGNSQWDYYVGGKGEPCHVVNSAVPCRIAKSYKICPGERSIVRCGMGFA